MGMRNAALVALIVLAATTTATTTTLVARASDETSEKQAPKRHWYGGETLAIGYGSLGVATIGAFVSTGESSSARNGGEAIMLAGIGAYAVGPAIDHFAHGQIGHGFASLGLNIGAPIVTGFLGAALVGSSVNKHGEDEEIIAQLEGFFLGALVGMLAAPAIDCSWAYDDAPAPTTVSVLPMVTSRHGAPVFGVQGLF